VLDTSEVALLDTLDGQSGDQSGTDTRSILGGKNLNGVLLKSALLSWPVQDLAQGLGTAGLEVRVLVEHGAIGTDVAGLVTLLLGNSSDTAGGEASSTGTDELGETAHELELRLCATKAKAVLKEVGRLGQVLKGILLDEGEEGGVESVSLAQLADILALKDVDLLVLVQVNQDLAEKFTEVETGNHLLESLLTWSWRLLVDDDIVWSAGKNLVLVVKCTPLAVDGHWSVWWKVHVGKLWDGTAVLHVRSVTSGTEDASDLHASISVGGSDKSTGGIVDQSGKLDWNALFHVNQKLLRRQSGETDPLGKGSFEHWDDIMALNTMDIKTLGPALKDTVVDVVLGGWV
jgi:hypothetical protein